MKRNSTVILLLALLTCSSLYSQTTFKTVRGTKTNYSISIPDSYFIKEAIGVNVDIKYANSEGASIITVVRTLPEGVKDSDVEQMGNPTDQEFINALESNGLQNISVIKRGIITINGVESYFAYYRSSELYYHTITQFRKGKLINLTYTCEYNKRDSYMPYIFRVVNSLKS